MFPRITAAALERGQEWRRNDTWQVTRGKRSKGGRTPPLLFDCLSLRGDPGVVATLCPSLSSLHLARMSGSDSWMSWLMSWWRGALAKLGWTTRTGRLVIIGLAVRTLFFSVLQLLHSLHFPIGLYAEHSADAPHAERRQDHADRSAGARPAHIPLALLPPVPI